MHLMRGYLPIAREWAGLTLIRPTMLFHQLVMSLLPGAETSAMSVLFTGSFLEVERTRLKLESTSKRSIPELL